MVLIYLPQNGLRKKELCVCVCVSVRMCVCTCMLVYRKRVSPQEIVNQMGQNSNNRWIW